MRIHTIFAFALFFAAAALLSGCGSKSDTPASVDETKPIAEVKAEAEKMNVEQLKATAQAYRQAIVAKQAELEKVAAKLKDIPVTEALGEEAKSIKTDLENLNKSVAALTERFQVYLEKLKELGADVSGLDIG
jgi:chromosome segregation ATPase